MTVTAERPTHRYRPLGSARELFACRDPEVLLSGAAGTGKSRACLEKIHAMCLLNPDLRALVLRKTAVSLTSTALVTYREIVAREAIASGEVVFYGGSRVEAACFRYSNGATITIGGIDKASRIMSSEYDIAYVQEAIELDEDDWEAISTRLRNGVSSFQQLMADTNPGPPGHWLNQRSIRGLTTMIPCRHEDNPRLWDGNHWTAEGISYITRLENLTGVRYQRLRKGLWAAAEGLVYEGFDPPIHLRKPLLMPPPEWTRYLAVDFGYRNPFTCQWWTENPDGQLIMYRELYGTGKLVEDWAREILAAIKRGDGQHSDRPPHTIICDHDAEDRATLERHLDMGTTAAHKSVSDGIQAVQARLKPGKNGKPGLAICRNALVAPDPALADAHKPLCLQDEVVAYIWDPAVARAAGETAREVPLKQDDHGCDAARYMVAHIDLVGRPRYRSIPASFR